jgi:dTMP kinase
MSKNQMTSPVFVVFEGLDGTGKTCSAAALAKELDGELIQTSSTKLAAEVKRLKNSEANCVEKCHAHYLESLKKASRKAAQILSSGRSVVMDRYLLSTNIYARVRGSKLCSDAISNSLLVPDLTVFLSLDSNERSRRLIARGDMTEEDKESIDNGFEKKLLQLYLASMDDRIVGSWFEVDAAFTTRDITRQICDRLGKNHSNEENSFGSGDLQ